MNSIPDSLNELILQFSRLPGIGKKTAERLAIYALKSKSSNILPLSNAIVDVKSKIDFHDICHCFMEDQKCSVCDDSGRDDKTLCIIKDPTDIFIIDKTGYRGHYHSLNGVISPLDGVDVDDLNFTSLLDRIKLYEEIIIALEPSSEGDATISYIQDILKEYDIKISRLAKGVPVGSSFEYIDELTLTHSLEDRVIIK